MGECSKKPTTVATSTVKDLRVESLDVRRKPNAMFVLVAATVVGRTRHRNRIKEEWCPARPICYSAFIRCTTLDARHNE